MTSSTLRNLKRKEDLIDYTVHLHPDGYPLPAWIELSPTDLCNRKCVFCPKSDPALPNRPLHMSPSLYPHIARYLAWIGYRGTVVLAGYGEPLLSPYILDMVYIFAKVCRVELVTSGDRLDQDTIRNLHAVGLAMFVVNMYDGPQQETIFADRFRRAGVPEDRYLLRDRWHGADQDYGVKLTNRAGVVTIGNQPPVVRDMTCYYPAYSMMVDWDGRVRVCAQDWRRATEVGDLATQSLLEVWNCGTLRTYRMGLVHGRHNMYPCQDCNACGTLHGAGHAEAWASYYARGAS